MLFAVLALGILVFTLVCRATRGGRIKDTPRKWERASVLKFLGKTIHLHHSYWGVIILMGGLWWDGWVDVGLALVISDVAFHIIAHHYWGDPIWD